MDTHTRKIATQELLKFFAYAHLPEHLQAISAPCCALALRMCEELPDSRELTVGLRKLLEAKDCFVRARMPSESAGEEGGRGLNTPPPRHRGTPGRHIADISP